MTFASTAAKRQAASRPAPAETSCPACDRRGLVGFCDLGELPVRVGTQYPTARAARECPRGRIELAYCPDCSFVTNVAYQPELLDYEDSYDNSLAFSGVYRAFEQAVANRLIERHGIRGKRVIEIGCGAGDFLERVCELGGNEGVGFDPSLDSELADSNGRVRYVRGYYPDDAVSPPADLLICRQVFEHMPEPRKFLGKVREALGDGSQAVLYFEVPSFDDVLRELGIWTIVYEHCSYFTRASLTRLFAECGFDVLDAQECYDNTFLSIEARPGGPRGGDVFTSDEPMGARVRGFMKRLDDTHAVWAALLNELGRQGRRAVVWGAGARAVSFLSLLPSAAKIEAVVDINPHKVGTFMPGTGHRVVSPDWLVEHVPDVVIVMNGIYHEEIARQVRGLGLHVEFMYA